MLTLIVSATFLGLALWHVYLALWPAHGTKSAVPSVDGRPVFVPSTMATLAVAVVLSAFASLVLATGGVLEVGAPRTVLAWLSYALALGLLARAVGEFKYVGFFKRVRGTDFARMDTLVYSPVCTLLALGVTAVAGTNGT